MLFRSHGSLVFCLPTNGISFRLWTSDQSILQYYGNWYSRVQDVLPSILDESSEQYNSTQVLQHILTLQHHAVDNQKINTDLLLGVGVGT